MGTSCSPGTCSPNNDKDELFEEKEIDMEQQEQAGVDDTNEKFTNIINDYQETNEQLRSEMDSLKNKNDEFIVENEAKTKRNEEVMRELNEMKALLDVKNRAIVKGRLQAALLSSMLSMESTSRLCIKGELKHHHMKRKIDKYAVVRICDGTVFPDDYKSGYVVLSFWDDKKAETAERYQILEVVLNKKDEKKEKPENEEKDVKKEHKVNLLVSTQDAVKDLAFSCETAEEKEDWIKAIETALAEVKNTYNDMHDLFTLKLEFSKEKMGIRVEESLVHKQEDEKSERELLRESGKVKKAIDVFEKQMSKPKNLEKAVNNMKKETVEIKIKDEQQESQEEDSKNAEDPCELLVTNISDEDLTAAGLRVNCVVRAINDMSLEGKGYTEQLDLLIETPKPYTLTFTGEKYLKHKPEREHAYQSIMKELTADGKNSVKSAFNELVEGTPFGKELEASTDKRETIQKLLSNQRRLMALLKNFNVQDIEL